MSTAVEKGRGRSSFVIAGCVTLFLILLAAVALFAPPPPAVVVGANAPPFVASFVSGPARTDTVFPVRGRVVVMNVWSTTCVPCVREMPSLQRLAALMRDSNVRLVGVSVDPSSVSAHTIDSVARSRGVAFDILHDVRGRLSSEYQIYGVPTTFVIDAQGRIRARESGGADWDDARHVALVRDAIAAKL